MHGQGINSLDEHGQKIRDDSFYTIFNAHHEMIEFKLPDAHWGVSWTKVVDTYDGTVDEEKETYKAEDLVPVPGRSIMVLAHKLIEMVG
jgi:glycogen operon protein